MKYELVSDENGTEKRQTFVSQDRALTAWQRATRRNSCYAAQLYSYTDEDVTILADWRFGISLTPVKLTYEQVREMAERDAEKTRITGKTEAERAYERIVKRRNAARLTK